MMPAMQGTRSATTTPAFSTARDLFRIVGKQAHGGNAEVAQNGAGKLVAAQVGIEAQALVGLHRIGAAVLQFIGAQLIQQADAAAFLVLVDEQAAAFGGDGFESDFELGVAIAPQAVEHVARQALGVDAHQRRRTGSHIAHAKHNRVLGAVPDAGAKAINTEVSEFAGEIGFGDFFEPGRGRVGSSEL